MHRLTPLILVLALAGLAPPALADGAGARASSGSYGQAARVLDADTWQLQLPLDKEVSVGAWPRVDRFDSLDGTERMVRVHAGVGLRYAREGFSFGAEAQGRVADLGSVPAEGAIDDHQFMARFAFDL